MEDVLNVLARPYDPVTYELVLARLHALGSIAPAYGLREQARAMYTSVAATRGDEGFVRFPS